MIATLESLSIGIGKWKARCLREAIDQNGLVCLGYSGRDAFDINPILRQKKNQNILWVLRRLGSNNTEIRNTLRYSEFKDPLYTDPTTFLVKTEKLNKNPSRFHLQPTRSLSEYMHPSAFLGRVLEAAQEYKAAREYYTNVLERSTYSNYFTFQMANIVRSLAVCNYELNNLDEALARLNTVKRMLYIYKKNLEENGRTPLNVERKILLEQQLLLSEELYLVYHNRNDVEQFESEEKRLLKILDEYERLFDDRLDILQKRSRILLNRAGRHLSMLAKSQTRHEYDYKSIAEDLEEVCKIKKSIGDFVGYVMALALLGEAKINLMEVDTAEELFLEVFAVDRTLRSVIPKGLKDLPFGSLCAIYFNKLNLGYYPVNENPGYSYKNGSLHIQFEDRLRKLLDKSPVESLKREKFLVILESDTSLQEILARMRRWVLKSDETYKYPLYLYKELSEVAKKYNVGIKTPDRKIKPYHEALKILTDTENTVLIGIQWQAIGDQYRKAGDYLQASASYRRALNNLRDAPTSHEFSEKEKKLYINALTEALASVDVQKSKS